MTAGLLEASPPSSSRRRGREHGAKHAQTPEMDPYATVPLAGEGWVRVAQPQSTTPVLNITPTSRIVRKTA